MIRLRGFTAAVLLACLPGSLLAANYFVDAAVGNDTHTGTAPTLQNGASSVGPWRSIARVNSATLQPGDNVFFRCGQSWRGTLRVISSPSASSPIKYARYGSDCNAFNKPTITASEALTGWQPYVGNTGNIWVARSFNNVSQVHVDGAALRLAQYPNPDVQVEAWSRGLLVIDRTDPSPNNNRGFYDADLAAISDRDLVGAGISIRVNDFSINDRVVSGFDTASNAITLSQVASQGLNPRWGYYFYNKLWMLDSPGEFFFDGSNPADMKVYVWMPDGAAPGNRVVTSSNAYAIDATSASNVVIENLRASRMGTGIAMSLSTNVVVRLVDIEDSYYQGILANNATGALIESCNIRRSVREGILAGQSTYFRILNNVVTDSGTIGSPVQSRGAITTYGSDNQIKGNVVRNSGYHGIAFGKRNDVANNLVENVCLALSDCGGIYTGNSPANNDSSPHNSVVFGNIVKGVHGNPNGRDPSFTNIITPGIYLDYRTANVYVAWNTVTDADMGIFVHAATGNTVADNIFHDYASFAIRIKDYWFSRITTPNKIQRNRFLGLYAGPPIMLVPATTTVAGMATYEGNRYSAMYTDNPETLEIAKTTTYVNNRYTDSFMNLQQWRQAGNDTAGTVFDDVRIGPFAFTPITGSNLLGNGTFDSGLNGWFAYAGQGDASVTLSTDCLSPGCALLTTGIQSSSGSLISPVFPVAAGKTYVVKFRDRAAGSAANVLVVPRMAGPRTYEPFQDRFPVNVIDAWRSRSVLFTIPPDFQIGPTDFGARVDFAAPPNTTLFVDDVRAEEVSYTANDPLDDSLLLMNPTSFSGTFSCPEALTNPQKCTEYVSFDDEAPVTWPVTVPARRTTILVWAGNPFRRP